MVILEIIGTMVAIVLLLIVIFASLSIFHHLWVLHSMRCKHCKHVMKYRGVGEHDGENKYMFECPKCGAWDYLPVTDVLK